MGDVWLSPVSITSTSNQLDYGLYSLKNSSCIWRRSCHWSLRSHSLDFATAMKLKRRRLVHASVKMKSFSLIATRVCSSKLERSSNGETMALDLESGLKENLCGLFVEDNLEEKPEACRSRIHYLEERDEEMLSKRLLKLSRLDKVKSASELFDSMRLSGLQPNPHACNSFLSCLLRSGNLQKLFTVFDFMRTKDNLTGHTYSLLLKAVSELKGCDSALRTFRELEKNPKHKSHFDVVLYNTVVSLSGRVNNVQETERVWRAMQSDGLTGTEVTYSLLVSIFVRCGRSELALDAYDEMVKNNVSPREDAMQAMISACTKEERWSLALKIFRSMLNKGMRPNLVACNALINSLAKAGKVGLVFKVYSVVVKSLGHKPDEYTWNALLTGLYKANRYEDVLQLFDMVRSEGLCCVNEYLYNTALVSCQKLGSWEKAVKLLYEMEGSGVTVSTSSYNLVISSCEKSRQSKVALRVYEHMVIRGCDPDTFTYLSLIRSCSWGSLWGEVKDILKVEPDVSLYNAAIHGMCLRREFKLAKELYVEMREMGLEPDGKTRAMMLQNLKRH
ncbi:pentatricopeptide repeat-containing protein At3g29290 isoform X2 [Brassica rapa]|uniref:pentatricopeptide repeat-containing protein At3g29290 isoform X2 n=1 Tax=Brassica campestris TaxID=3711 RepID=UPI0004F14638|nr:pentatricopeptide repeat-containing protein At3g29290 isoform X2 [Brassica rapa]